MIWDHDKSSNLKHFKPLLICWRVHYPSENHHSNQGTELTWKCVHGVYLWKLHSHDSITGLKESSQMSFPKYHTSFTFFPFLIMLPVTMSSTGKQWIWKQPLRLCKRKHDLEDQLAFFHCSVIRICSCAIVVFLLYGEKSEQGPWLVCGYATPGAQYTTETLLSDLGLKS